MRARNSSSRTWIRSRATRRNRGFVDAGKQEDSIGAFDLVAMLAKLPLGKVVAPYIRLGYVFYDTTTTVESGGVKAT